MFASEFVLRRLGRLSQAILILAIGLILTRPAWTIWKTLYFAAVLFGQYLYFFGLFVIGAALTFWTVRPIEAVNIFTYGGTELMSYPMSIYSAWIRRFFTFIVPAAFINYLPALYFLDKPDPLGFPPFARFLAPLAGLALAAAAYGFWQIGIRHYTSTGS